VQEALVLDHDVAAKWVDRNKFKRFLDDIKTTLQDVDSKREELEELEEEFHSIMPEICLLCEQIVEKWKPIVSYEGLYEVSNLGRVKTFHKGGNYPDLENIPKLKAQTSDQDGYKRVSLYGKSRGLKDNCIAVHRLVLEAFVGPCPEGMESSHIDGDCANNRLENLLWETHLQNNKRKIEHGTALCGENHPLYGKKLSEEQCKKMSESHKGKFTGKDNPFYGKKHTNESIQKMSESHRKTHQRKRKI